LINVDQGDVDGGETALQSK